MFRFASTQDKILIAIGILGALAGGCSLPVMIVLFGELANSFVTNDLDPDQVCNFIPPQCCRNGSINIGNNNECDLTPDDIGNFVNENFDFLSQIQRFGAGSAIIGAVNFVMSYIFVTCLNHAAECQVYKIRRLFLQSMLRQDIGWYDTNQTSDFAAKITEDLNKLQEGIGEKIGMFIFFVTICSGSIINAFLHGWELTLVMMAAMPVLCLATGIIAKSQTKLTEKEFAAYGKAGAIAEEVLSSIRTVMAFEGQKKEVERFEGKLVYARKAGIKRGVMTGVGGGLMWLIIYSSYALAFWYGVKLIMDDREACFADLGNCQVRYDPSSLLIVFFSVLMGAMNVGQASPYVEAFSMARAAAAAVYRVIDRVPEIDSLSDEGEKPGDQIGNITFSDVYFNYPSRHNVKVLQGLDLTIKKGETVALVGPSGCGKSTVIQLLQRFYDPLSGSIHIGNCDMKKVNVKWLRNKIGVVGQEPVLFGCTIAENIRQGRDNVTKDEMEKACVEASALDFIMKLPKKYDTLVGESGAQLSGGQKQRIAIARALVRNPEILLLDEATSALDTQSEAIVQKALDRASSGRTTIVVAHRLSTVRGASKIVALKDGQVVEIGTHDELMRAKGLYHSLVEAQMSEEEQREEESEHHDEVKELDSQPQMKSLDHIVPDRSFRKQATIDRKISVSSIISDDSIDMFEDAGRAAGSGIALARMNSTGEIIKKRGSMRNMSEVDVKPNDKNEDIPKVDTLRIVRMNSKEWPYILLGSISSVIMGASMPVYAMLFGEVLGLLSQPIDIARSESKFYAIMFFVVGVVVGSAMFLQVSMYTVAGEHLTQRMRRLAFESMLRQEIGWFDQPCNSTGALCSRLSADAGAIQGATGSRWGAITQSVFTVVMAVGGGIYYDWKLGLVGALFVPFVVLGSVAQAKTIASHDNIEKEALETSARLAIEAITNIRTVAGLGREESFVKRYVGALSEPHIQAKKKAHIRGAVFGFAQSTPFFAYACCMYYGGYLVKTEGLPFKNCFKVAEALILGSMVVGQATAFAPNYSKAIIAAARIFRLLDRKPLIDTNENSGVKMNQIDGNITFEGARFCYPTRQEVKVLRDLNLALKSGQNVAFVGPSGCGKSTCIQLLQRFYDLESGNIKMDCSALDSLNIPWLRSNMGIVSQEPVLFDRTIAENIMYGDNKRQVSMDEVVDAARRANIHSFITSLPQGYDTRVGEKGAQLSGGQKQRVAIARALIRNPKILLLDEATSALDTESEKIVQEALDKAQEGRTSITIAHRLSTVQSADKIFVISHGRVIESGTHSQLLSVRGMYFKLWSRQAGTI